jgi:1-acyl-sn-glycerol-3-phosphate acyltransferase
MVRVVIKIPVFLILVLPFILTSFFTDISIRDRKKKLICFSKIASFFSKLGLKALGIKVNVKNYENLPQNGKNYLIVSNHLSYTDIFIISSVIPSIFIASIDQVRNTSVLGTIAKFGGSVFVERRSVTNLSKEIEAVSNMLKEGFNMVLFPEGTTSNGDCVLPFKAPFLISAIRSNVDVLPICLKYKMINGENLDSQNRDLVFYYSDMTFFKHFFRFLLLKSVDVELIGLGSINVSSDLTRKELVKSAFSSISSTYQ